MICPANGVVTISSPSRPIVSDRCVRRPRARWLGAYPSSAAIRRTRSRVAGLIRPTSFRLWETVVVETPAAFATTLMPTVEAATFVRLNVYAPKRLCRVNKYCAPGLPGRQYFVTGSLRTQVPMADAAVVKIVVRRSE